MARYKSCHMTALAKLFLVLGGANAALVVLLGAFGAHVLDARLSADMIAVYHTAVLYHAIHGLGLIAVGGVAAWLPGSGFLKASGWSMFAGILLFSGSLYILSVAGVRWAGAITPLGGTAFIVAWVLFCVAVVKARP